MAGGRATTHLRSTEVVLGPCSLARDLALSCGRSRAPRSKLVKVAYTRLSRRQEKGVLLPASREAASWLRGSVSESTRGGRGSGEMGTNGSRWPHVTSTRAVPLQPSTLCGAGARSVWGGDGRSVVTATRRIMSGTRVCSPPLRPSAPAESETKQQRVERCRSPWELRVASVLAKGARSRAATKLGWSKVWSQEGEDTGTARVVPRPALA